MLTPSLAFPPPPKVLNSFLAKSEGKDKLLATLQYIAMLIAAGKPGNAASVQKSLVTARKPFRVLKPVELLLPLITGPPTPGPFHASVLSKVRGSGAARVLRPGRRPLFGKGGEGGVEVRARINRGEWGQYARVAGDIYATGLFECLLVLVSLRAAPNAHG